MCFMEHRRLSKVSGRFKRLYDIYSFYVTFAYLIQLHSKLELFSNFIIHLHMRNTRDEGQTGKQMLRCDNTRIYMTSHLRLETAQYFPGVQP
jgi:DUF1365 family protein